MNDDDRADVRREDNEDTVPQQGSWRARNRRACLGFGVVALLGSVSVALCALLVASQPQCLGSCDERTVAEAWGWAVAAASAALLAVALVAWLRRHNESSREDRTFVGALALLYLVVAGVALTELAPWTDLHWALTQRPATMQGPAVAGAVVLCLLGAVALGLGRHVLSEGWKPVPRSTIGGAVLAAAVVAALTIAAWSAGNDSRFVHASTAGGGEVPPAPQEFGVQRFHLRLPYRPVDPDVLFVEPVEILAAGTVFVLFDKDRGELVAYDFSGAQRWHYQRTGPDALRIFDVHAYDDGRTLVVAFASSRGGPAAQRTFMGMDAVSGQQLWTRSGELLEDAFGRGRYRSPYLVARQKDSWTAFDARTGEQIWRVPNPERCGDPGQFDGPPGLLVDVEVCQASGAITYTLITVDAATGKVVRQQQLQRIDRASGDVQIQNVERAGRDGVVMTVSWSDGRRVHTYANALTGHVTEIDAHYVSNDEGRDGDFFTQIVSDEVRMIGADGEQRCAFPYATSPIGDWSDVGVAWFPQQLAYTNTVDDKSYLRVADRDTCQILESMPIAGEPLALRVARGVTVLVSVESDGVYLTGYSP